MPRIICLILALAMLSASAAAKTHRSTSAKHEFQRQHPCPATGQPRGKCPGYVIDHVTPLCAGGPDAPANMQWQTVADSKVKDVEERRYCRALKSTH
jgi:hypothetical protein